MWMINSFHLLVVVVDVTGVLSDSLRVVLVYAVNISQHVICLPTSLVKQTRQSAPFSAVTRRLALTTTNIRHILQRLPRPVILCLKETNQTGSKTVSLNFFSFFFPLFFFSGEGGGSGKEGQMTYLSGSRRCLLTLLATHITTTCEG